MLYTIQNIGLLLDVLVNALVSKYTGSCVVPLVWQAHLTVMDIDTADYQLVELAPAQARSKHKRHGHVSMENQLEGSGRYQG